MRAPKESASLNELLQQAHVLHQAGRLPEAEALYKKLLKTLPKSPIVLTALGTIALQLGQLNQAAMLLGKSLKADPHQAGALSNRGIALAQLNRLREAADCFEAAIAIHPNYVEALNNLGNVLLEMQRFEEALDAFDKTIALNPGYADAHCNRGNALQDMQRYEEALSSFERAIALRTDYAEAYYNHGNALIKLDRLNDALLSYQRAIALKPRYAEAFCNLGNTLKQLKRLDEALHRFKQAISCQPNYPEALQQAGVTLLDLGQAQAALEYIDKAIALQPEVAEMLIHKGNALKTLRQMDAACKSYSQAISMQPDFAKAYNSRGCLLQEIRQFDDALADYDQAIALTPDYAQAIWNKALLKLKLGQFEEGWRLYESRWQSVGKDHLRSFTQPLWLGEQAVQGKTLLIHSEQGMGDIIQFCRFIPLLENLGAKTIFEVTPALYELLSTLTGEYTLIRQSEPLPDFDFYCPLLSLPLAFNTKPNSIPASVPYLYADPDKQTFWRQRLGSKDAYRAGLVWSGSIGHVNDHNRSLSVSQLQSLFDLPVEFHCLQNEIRETDQADLPDYPGLQQHSLLLKDFADTAALISELDLVITVDTAIAHLAGAMAKPVWILLPYAADFRWMKDGTDSLWYPTATLFRQTEPGDWRSVLTDIRNKLEKLANPQLE
jgi:tetratricopeptide (TPR) repeat protein